MNERRRAKRVGFRRRVWCEGDRFTVWLSTIDVSREGLQVRTSIPPPPGTRLRVTLEEPAHGRIVAETEVVWTGPVTSRGGMGLRIVRFVEGGESWSSLVRDADES